MKGLSTMLLVELSPMLTANCSVEQSKGNGNCWRRTVTSSQN